MRNTKRLTAWFLALALAICGLPVSTAAEDTASTQTQMNVLPETNLRLIQKVEHDGKIVTVDNETGFATQGYDNGVLTMTLQMKPATAENFPREAHFLFRIDSSVLTPRTNPAIETDRSSPNYGKPVAPPQEISPGNGVVDVVTEAGNRCMYDSGAGYLLRDDVEGVGCATRSNVANGDYLPFSAIMGASGVVNSAQSFYMVTKDTQKPGYLDCYLRLGFSGTLDQFTTGSDGYIDLLDLKFSCPSREQLFANSIQMPKDDADARTIMKNFPYWEAAGMEDREAVQAEIAKYNDINKTPRVFGPVYYQAATPEEALAIWKTVPNVQVSYTTNQIRITGAGTVQDPAVYSLPEIDTILDGISSENPKSNNLIELRYIQTNASFAGISTTAEERQKALEELGKIGKYNAVSMEISNDTFPVQTNRLMVSMVSGAAAYVDGEMMDYSSTEIATSKDGYYYYDKPAWTSYHLGTLSASSKRVKWIVGTDNEEKPLNGVPGIWYDNCNKKYILDRITDGLTNTYTDQVEIYREETQEDTDTEETVTVEVPTGTYKDSNDDPDFIQEKNASGIVTDTYREPRYVIPTLDEEKALTEKPGATLADWIPQRWTPAGSSEETKLRVPLKYKLNTEVTGKSISSPMAEIVDAAVKEYNQNHQSETVAVSDASFPAAGFPNISMKDVLDRVSWDFVLDGSAGAKTLAKVAEEISGSDYQFKETALANVATSNPSTGDATLNVNGYHYKVTELEITEVTGSGDTALLGLKLWKAQLFNGTEDQQKTYYTPEGVTLDFLKLDTGDDEHLKSGLTYRYISETVPQGKELVDREAILPQLHVQACAADHQSIMWYNMASTDRTGRVYLRPTYTHNDNVGTQYVGSTIAIRLERKTSIPHHVSIDGGDFSVTSASDPNAGKGADLDVWVGKASLSGVKQGTSDTLDDDVPVTTRTVDGRNVEFRVDPFTDGVVLYAALYDQYGQPFDQDVSVTMTLDSDSENKAAMETAIGAKGGLPFTVGVRTTDVNPEDHGYESSVMPEGEYAYTIKYVTDRVGSVDIQRNANKVVPGDYIITASYSAPGAAEPLTDVRKVRVHKSVDRLGYMSTTLSQATIVTNIENTTTAVDQTDEGEEIYAQITVPSYSIDGGGAVVAKKSVFSVRELANQWRVDLQGSDTSQFDIVQGLRSEEKLITMQKINEAADVSMEFSLVDDQGKTEGVPVPTGIDISGLKNHENPTLAYDYRVVGQTKIRILVQANYKDSSLKQYYNITFVRTASQVKDIRLKEFNQSTKTLRVEIPDSSSSTLNVQQSITLDFYDQYNNWLNWSDLVTSYAPGEPNNDTTKPVAWRLMVDPADRNALAANSGVTMMTAASDTDKDHNNVISVDKMAEPITFKVYAEFGNEWKYADSEISSGSRGRTFYPENSRSRVMWTIEVYRANSKPANVDKFAYHYNNRGIDVEGTSISVEAPPAKDGADINCNPVSVIRDQYNQLLRLQDGAAAPDTYTATYTLSITKGSAISGSMDEKLADLGLAFNPATGVLTVKKCAKPCTVEIVPFFTAAAGTGGSNKKVTINVVRASRITSSLDKVTEDKQPDQWVKQLEYLTTAQLRAMGTNQYGDSELYGVSDVKWTLEAVTFADGRTVTRTVPAEDNGQYVDLDGVVLAKNDSGQYIASGEVVPGQYWSGSGYIPGTWPYSKIVQVPKRNQDGHLVDNAGLELTKKDGKYIDSAGGVIEGQTEEGVPTAEWPYTQEVVVLTDEAGNELSKNGSNYVANGHDIISGSWPYNTVTNQIPLREGVYAPGNNVVALTTNGKVTFSSTNQASSLPKSIRVRAVDGSAAVEATIPIHLEDPIPKEIVLVDTDSSYLFQKPDGGAKPDGVVTLRASVVDQYGISRSGTDDKGKNWDVVWTGELKAGFELKNNVLTVNQNADYGSYVIMKATYEDLTPQSVEISVEMENEDTLVVRDVEIISLAGDGKTQNWPTEPWVELPKKSGTTYADYSLTAVVHATDGNVWPRRAVTWSIEKVESQDGTSLKSTDVAQILSGRESWNGNPQLRFNYSEAVRDKLNAGQWVKATVKVDHLDKNNQSFSDTKTIEIRLANTRVITGVTAERDNGTYGLDKGKVKLPTQGEDNCLVNITATVLDQYGLPLDPAKASSSTDADIEFRMLNTTLAGRREFSSLQVYSTSEVPKSNKGQISVGSKLPESSVKVEYWAKNLTSVRDTIEVDFQIGTLYPDSLHINTTRVTGFVPELTLNPEEINSIPTDLVWKSGDLSLRAEVWAQNDEWSREIAQSGVRPVWKTHEDYVGKLEFDPFIDSSIHKAGEAAEPLMVAAPDANGEVVSEEVTLRYSNKAVPKSEKGVEVLEKTYLLDLTTQDHRNREGFEGTVEVVLKRNPSQAKYLVFQGADENGVWTTPVMRPTEAQGEAEYQLVPQVYDQYGYLMETSELDTVPALDLLLEGEGLDNNQRVTVQKVYPADVKLDEDGNPVDEEGNPVDVDPIGYEIYRAVYVSEQVLVEPEPGQEEEEPQYVTVTHVENGEKLVAFDRASGTLTLTNECDPSDEIGKLEFSATMGDLTKEIEVNIAQESIYPARVEFVPPQQIFEIDMGAGKDLAEMENEVRTVEPIVYDQYGHLYNGQPFISWEMYLPREDGGAYTSADLYKEVIIQPEVLDEEGNVVTPETRTSRTSDQQTLTRTDYAAYTRLTMRPANYVQLVKAVLRCHVQDEKNVTDDKRSADGDLQISVDEKKAPPAPSGGGYYSPAPSMVSFEVGEFGKLIGKAALEIEPGDYVSAVPSVKPAEGYAFLGWTVDGETLVDPSIVQINQDVTFRAVYRKISTSAFVNGYGDGTVRPFANITRAECVTMIVRAMGGYDPDAFYGESFPDVGLNRWYSNYIAYAKQYGIASGYLDGTFRPDNYVTRAEAAKLLAVAAGLPLSNTHSFSDIAPEKWYARPIAALKEAGAANGYEDGTFRPDQYITRAEMIKMTLGLTNNALDSDQLRIIKETAYCPFTDLSRDSWAYAYILRAAGIA